MYDSIAVMVICAVGRAVIEVFGSLPVCSLWLAVFTLASGFGLNIRHAQGV